MDILNKARAGQNALEGIVNAVPGFKGYREKELRRDADKLQREYLANALEECKKTLNDHASEATRSGRLDALNEIETARKRLDKVVARIRYADRGYAGFFDTIKVDDAVLQRIYEFDLSLLADVDAVRQATGLEHAAVAAMIDRLAALDTKLGEREAILSGIR
jgi:hypothetical protein